MKIKYSNKIKENLSTSLLQELVQLSYTAIPYQAVHCFSFENIKNNEICITHHIPNINLENKIILSCRDIPNEDIYLIRTPKTLYVLTQSEYLSL